MSESIETKGKTVDEAVREALLQLGLRRDEVEITVLEEPRAGLMGFIGTRQAKVLVSKRRSRDRRGGGGRERRDDEHRAHDLTAEGSSGRGRGRGGRGGRDGAAREGAGRDSTSRDSGGRGGRDTRDARDGRDRPAAPAGERSERGGRGRGGRGGRDLRETRDRDEARPARDEAAPRPRAAEGAPAGDDRPDGQRSRRRRGGRGRGGRGRSGQGEPREETQGIDTTALELGTDRLDAVEVRREEPRGERGGRGRGGRGGRDRNDRPDRPVRDRGERPARERDEIRFDQPDDGGFVAEAAPREEIVPRERAREERSRRELRVAPPPPPVPPAPESERIDGVDVVDSVENVALPAVPAAEVIETAVIANVAPRAKPRAWGGLGARREKRPVGQPLPRVEEPSPATAGAVIKPSRKAVARAAERAERAERAAAPAPQIGEIASPHAGPRGTSGYGAPSGGGFGGYSGRGGAEEVIASGLAATDYAKALAPVDEAGQPAMLTDLANGMLARAGFPCQVDTVPGEYHGVKVTADEDDAGMLIGRAGSTAEAIEHLVERMASNAAGDRVRMNLDINEYRVRREEAIREHTAEAVADVRQSGEPYHMESMDARERRIVHMATADLPDITTYTVVGAGGKHVVIMLDDGSQPDDGGHEGGDE